MAKWQWAALWKRAAKNYRAMFKLCALTSVPLWKERYWASQRSAKAWKATAKKWRRKAAHYEIIPRRPFYDNLPDGLEESDKDFVANNFDVCVAFLEENTA